MIDFKMYPTIVTPFDEGGAIDYESLEKLVEMFRQAGCEGIFAVCQSSEMFFLTEEEKLELARRTLQMCRARGMKCVVSGHTQDRLEEQIAYLRQIEELEPDAIILVSNRFAAQDEDDQIAVERLQAICAALKPETRLGVYECPYPYKRLLTTPILQAMIADGRFRFVKDTCCQIDLIRQRLQLLQGTPIALYNANTATLGESMAAGAVGYSGIQLNLMPEFFTLLQGFYREDHPVHAQRLLNYLSFTSTIECQNYPANAKYCLMQRGLMTTPLTRNGKPPLTESQMKKLDAFMAVNRQAYVQFLPKPQQQALFQYDSCFPECHASTVLPLKSGRVLVAYFAGTYEKHDDVGIWLSIREDGVWRKPRCIAKVEDSAHWNPVLYQTEEGVRLIFKVGKTIPAWRSYTMLSVDEGEHWSEPVPMAADHPANGPVRNKPLWLSDGRWLAPNSDESEAGWYPRVDESTDGGRTFHRMAPIPLNRTDAVAPDYMAGQGAIQPTLWESAPGHVHALLRTAEGHIYRSDSADGGRTWCCAYPTALPNNNSGIDLVQVRGKLYLVLNPVGLAPRYRTPLTVKVSADNGATFTDFCVLEDQLFDEPHNRYGGFAYPAITQMDDTLYITYTHNRKAISFCQIDLTKKLR